MKRLAIIFMGMILLAGVVAETSIDYQVNYFFSKNDIGLVLEFENSSHVSYARLEDNYLKVEKEGRTLALDINSLKSRKDDIRSLNDDIRPDRILVTIGMNPKISFMNKEEIISVEQISEGETKISFMQPAIAEEEGPAVYIVEHYYPEKTIPNKARKSGISRLTAIAKNDPGVVIDDIGLSVMADEKSIGTRSFFTADLSKSQVDIIGEDKVSEIIGFEDSIFMQVSPLGFDALFDRGYMTGDINRVQVKKVSGFDVTPDGCGKLGFAFLPGYGYDLLNQTDGFTRHRGWVMGSAYSEENNFGTSLDDMAIFVRKAYESNLTPIVRVDSEKFDPKAVSDFINRLSSETGGRLLYVQIGDKPNNKGIGPEDYADFVVKVRKDIDARIKIISAALMTGDIVSSDSRTGYDARTYIMTLIKYPGFADSIDYLGANAYGQNITGKDCVRGNAMYDGENICIDDITSYRVLLEIMKQVTGKSYQAIISDAGYAVSDDNFRKAEMLLQSFKEDSNVMAAMIYSANSWKESPADAWLNADGTLTGFAQSVSKEVCS